MPFLAHMVNIKQRNFVFCAGDAIDENGGIAIRIVILTASFCLRFTSMRNLGGERQCAA
jgi:hypothetical protein